MEWIQSTGPAGKSLLGAMMLGGELSRWDRAATGVQPFLGVQLTDEVVDVALCILEIKVAL
jgi:hypothetical protein